MYICGPTVYDYVHVGHARTYIAFDVIRRYFEHVGFDVILIINITDIDDKIINKARETKRPWEEIAEYYIKDFFEAMKLLNVKPAKVFPRVTNHIDDIIYMTRALLEKGHAYVADDGSVYFSVDKVEHYGALSKQRPEELIAGARVEVNPYKRNPLDFALWKAWKPNEPWWASPWGPGRPGWHIECVAMSTRYLGHRFDIHGGGQDLIFPHHENELAIARACLGPESFARYWLHTGLVMIGGKKMSKSLRNIVPIKELTSKYDVEVIRLYLASTHYRKPLDFNYEGLEQYREVLNTLYTAHDYLASLLKEKALDLKDVSLPQATNDAEQDFLKRISLSVEDFERGMSNDFNTSQAISALIRLARTCIAMTMTEEKLGNSILLYAYSTLRELSEVFGVLSRALPPLNLEALIYELVDLIVEVRSELRSRKLWSLSDRIRDRLLKVGILLNDTRFRTLWKWRRYA